MAGLNGYLSAQDTAPAPGSAEWLKMIGQASVMNPDQAQIAMEEAGAGAPPPSSLADDNDAKSGRLSSVANSPMPKEAPVPVAQNFMPGQGLNAYLPPATKAMDRSLLDQYKAQSQASMNDQKAGISQLEQMRADVAGKPVGFNWAPVGAFADYLNGQFGQKTDLQKLGQDNRGMTEDQKNDKLLKLQEYIQGSKGNMSKESLQATQQMMQMLHQNDQTNLMAQHYANLEKSNDTRSNAFADRNTIARENQAKAVGDLFDKDPIIRPQVDRLNQIKLDRHTLESGGTINAQVMDEISAGIASALAGGKGAGFHATELQQIQSAGKDLAKNKSYFLDKPFNALSKENQQFLTGLLTRLEKGYGNAIGRRADQLRQGRDYPANPLAVKVLNDKTSYYKGFGDSGDTSGGAPKAGDVVDGYKFKGGEAHDENNWEKQ